MRTIVSITFAALTVAAASAPAFAQEYEVQRQRPLEPEMEMQAPPAEIDEGYTGSIPGQTTEDERSVYDPRPGTMQVRPEFPQADRDEGEAGGSN